LGRKGKQVKPVPGYLVPSYIKPYSKILSWSLPMIYIEEEEQEYISELAQVSPAFKENIIGFKDYTKLVMSKDLRGTPEKYKVAVDINTKFVIPVEEFVRRATKEKEFARLQLDLNLLSPDSYKAFDKIYNSLDKDLRATISIPTQWLVYARRENMLTRLCWVVKISGEVVIRPYGARGILIETDTILLDKVNTPSLRTIKKNVLLKQRLNDYWRRLVATQLFEEEASELMETLEVSETSEGAGMVGNVE